MKTSPAEEKFNNLKSGSLTQPLSGSKPYANESEDLDPADKKFNAKLSGLSEDF